MAEFLTKAQAAGRLGLSERSIYKLINKGHLRPFRRGRRVGVLAEDVLALEASRKPEEQADPGDGPPTRRELAGVHAQLLMLENRMSVVRRLLNCYHQPLALSDLQLTGYYRLAEEQAAKGWPRDAEQVWVDFFQRIGHDELERLRGLVDDIHPWRPFYRLCATMVLVPFDRGLRDELKAGKENLLQLMELWLELGGNGPMLLARLVRRDATPSGRLVRRLKAGIHQPKPRPRAGV
jgi:excisionase family DNA binding protein